MRLIVLGCSGSGPGPSSPASGYLLEVGDARFVMDLGNGTFGALQRHCDPWTLDGVLFSHLHPDHCADFSALAVFRRYHPRPPYDATARRLPVLAPVEAPTRFAAAYAPSAAELAGTDMTDLFDFRVISDGTTAGLAGATVRVGRVDHPCDAYGLRVEAGGRSIVYSGDTGPCDGLVELARGADVLLCEASWPHHDDAPPGVHLSGRQAGEHASAAGVHRLLLTHVPAWFDGEQLLGEAREAFDGPVELVTPDATYEI
jgi:ribonuclease BN (tRNA processing enzyme)